MGATQRQPKIRQGAGYTFIEVKGVVHSECAGCNKHFAPKDLRVPRFVDIMCLDLERPDGTKIRDESDLTVADLRVLARCEPCMAKLGVFQKGGKMIDFRNAADSVRKARRRTMIERERNDDDVAAYMRMQVVPSVMFPMSGGQTERRAYVAAPTKPKVVVVEQPKPEPFDMAKYTMSKAELAHAAQHGRWPKGATLGRGGQMVKKAEVERRLERLEEEHMEYERASVIAQLAAATGWKVRGRGKDGKKK